MRHPDAIAADDALGACFGSLAKGCLIGPMQPWPKGHLPHAQTE